MYDSGGCTFVLHGLFFSIFCFLQVHASLLLHPTVVVSLKFDKGMHNTMFKVALVSLNILSILCECVNWLTDEKQCTEMFTVIFSLTAVTLLICL